ncbi:MAG: hypothetical protein JWO33_1434 [Caulobacteraceae bacterium]|nr:hypothetical protein [Caulobacteraceae bacterium]
MLHSRKPLPDDVPEGLKPRLRLFLSADLVGSTQFKQSRQAWRPEILSFYRNFDYVLHSQSQKFSESLESPVPAPEFWKSNGDELLYTWALENLADAHSILHIWLAALEEYRASGAHAQHHLHLKSTAWIGLFPIPNSEVFFRRGAAQARSRSDDIHDSALVQSEIRDEWYSGGAAEITKEYVGPSIDTGFRLTSWATPGRLIISVDLAFLLTSSHPKGVAPLPLRMGGKDRLKGVIDDAPYPAIWIALDERNAGHDGVRGRELTVNPSEIKSACEAIIEQNYQFITPIFMSVASYDDYEWAPPYILRQIAQHWREEQAYKAARLEEMQTQSVE